MYILYSIHLIYPLKKCSKQTSEILYSTKSDFLNEVHVKSSPHLLMYTLLQLVFIISPTLLHMAFIISIAHCIQLSFIIPPTPLQLSLIISPTLLQLAFVPSPTLFQLSLIISPTPLQLAFITSPIQLQISFIISPNLLQLALILSPTAVILLLVVLVYGWVAPPPVAPSEPFGSLVEVNGSFSYHEKSIDEEQGDRELGVWSLSLTKLYSPQVISGE